MTRAHRVLVVDDEPRNLSLISAMLDGFEVEGDPIEITAASSGSAAIEAFSHALEGHRPSFDLVLLDIMMPDLDGLTVIGALRALSKPADRVAVVLATALDSRSDRVRGLEAGADDFLTKPLDAAELRCRVRTFLSLRRTERSLALRARELEVAQQAKAELTSMIVHDLKNPLSGVSGSLSWLERALARQTDPVMIAEAIEDAQEGTRRMLSLIRSLAEVERAESGALVVSPVRCSMSALLEGHARVQRKAAAARNLTIEVRAEDLELDLDRDLVGRVIENLLENAIRHAAEGGSVLLEAHAQGGRAEIAVSNTGAPISEKVQSTLFSKYARGERRHDAHLGLGLYFCHLAARAHGGSVHAESTAVWPARFVVRLSARQAKGGAPVLAPFARG